MRLATGRADADDDTGVVDPGGLLDDDAGRRGNPAERAAAQPNAATKRCRTSSADSGRAVARTPPTMPAAIGRLVRDPGPQRCLRSFLVPSDIETDDDGSASQRFIGRFNIETFIVAPGSAPAPVVHDQPPFPDASENPATFPVHTSHLGLWFNSPADASSLYG